MYISKKSSSFIFLVVAFALVIGITVLFGSSGSGAPVQPVAETPVVPATASGAVVPAAGSYTMSQVSAHNSRSDCWTTINGGVYDVTAWISEHPGGAQAIVGLCGIDGSMAFNDEHGGERRPASELAGFKIGVLAK